MGTWQKPLYFSSCISYINLEFLIAQISAELNNKWSCQAIAAPLVKDAAKLWSWSWLLCYTISIQNSSIVSSYQNHP